MKSAIVAAKWIGTGQGIEDKWRIDLPEGYSSMVILGHQYVNLALDCPSPNIALALIEEDRKDHEGYIDSLKPNLNQIVIETWEGGGPVVPIASTVKLKGFLIRQGMEEDMAEMITDANVNRAEVLLDALDALDTRARRRIELERERSPQEQAELEARRNAEAEGLAQWIAEGPDGEKTEV